MEINSSYAQITPVIIQRDSDRADKRVHHSQAEDSFRRLRARYSARISQRMSTHQQTSAKNEVYSHKLQYHDHFVEVRLKFRWPSKLKKETRLG